MDKVRAAVIGVGKMGEYHVGVLSDLSQVTLVEVIDIKEDRAREIGTKYNIPWGTDTKNLSSKIDLAILAVPTSLHYSMAKELLKSGIHVLLEKPCADNLAHARELFEIAENNQLILHIGHVERFNVAVQELYKLVDEPIIVECKRVGPFAKRMRDDGVVLDIMIHDIDILLNLIGSKVARINVMGVSVFTDKDDLVSVQMQFENGCVANIIASRVSQNKERTLAITQKDSYVLLDYTDQEIYVHRKSSSEHTLRKGSLRYRQESLVERIFVHKDNPLKLEIQHFLDCVTNGSPRKVAVDNELYSLEIALEIVEQFKQQVSLSPKP